MNNAEERYDDDDRNDRIDSLTADVEARDKEIENLRAKMDTSKVSFKAEVNAIRRMKRRARKELKRLQAINLKLLGIPGQLEVTAKIDLIKFLFDIK